MSDEYFDNFRSQTSIYSDVKVSLLLACKGNYEQFQESVDNISNTCSDKKKAEIILKIDTGDNYKFYLRTLQSSGLLYKVIIYDPLEGYNDLHIFYNDTAKLASGDILWLSTDDVIPYKGDWLNEMINTRDTIYKDNVYIINFNNNIDIFPPQRAPAFTRELYNILGYVSPYRAWDKFYNMLATHLNRRVYINTVKLKPSAKDHPRRGGIAHNKVHMLSSTRLSDLICKYELPKFKNIICTE